MEEKHLTDQEILQLYLDEIRKVPPLTPEEKQALIRRLADGDMDAANHLAMEYVEMVVPIAREYEGRGLIILDLIQEGNNGLVRAVKEFDWESDGEFAPFADIWIRRGIWHGFNSCCIEHRIPVEWIEQVNKVVRARRELEQQLGREPAPEEVARSLGISEEKIQEFLGQPKEEDEDLILELELEMKEPATPEDMLREALKTDNRLTCREKAVLIYRFGLDGHGTHTLEETGQFFRITRERIRQIERKVIRHRHANRSKKIRDFYA